MITVKLFKTVIYRGENFKYAMRIAKKLKSQLEMAGSYARVVPEATELPSSEVLCKKYAN